MPLFCMCVYCFIALFVVIKYLFSPTLFFSKTLLISLFCGTVSKAILKSIYVTSV